ncbi:hypothetical protein O0L34_g6609 [Tuta absoluta]|nr:hypothetical protein O0L34_g6609 [Tuta absoluta]
MSTANATSVLGAKNEDKSLFENIMDSCRLCKELHKNMKDIFTEEHRKIIEQIHFCTGLQLINEEWLPTHICDKCTQNLTVAHSFKATCLTTNEYYQDFMKKIKTEHQDTEFDDHFDNVDDEKDCKDILKEVLKLSDIKITKLKKENNSLDRRKRQVKLNKTKSPKTKLAKSVKKLVKMKTVKLSKFSCDVCSIEYTSKEELAEHRKTVHTEKETFVCEVCGKVMLHRASLYTHMQSHLPPRHACDSCDYKTWHKHDLAKHKRIHSGVKMFQCEFCTASYHTSSNLRHHIRSNHENAPKTFQCRLCDRSFYDRTKLQRHVDAHNDIKR